MSIKVSFSFFSSSFFSSFRQTKKANKQKREVPPYMCQCSEEAASSRGSSLPVWQQRWSIRVKSSFDHKNTVQTLHDSWLVVKVIVTNPVRVMVVSCSSLVCLKWVSKAVDGREEKRGHPGEVSKSLLLLPAVQRVTVPPRCLAGAALVESQAQETQVTPSEKSAPQFKYIFLHLKSRGLGETYKSIALTKGTWLKSWDEVQYLARPRAQRAVDYIRVRRVWTPQSTPFWKRGITQNEPSETTTAFLKKCERRLNHAPETVRLRKHGQMILPGTLNGPHLSVFPVKGWMLMKYLPQLT